MGLTGFEAKDSERISVDKLVRRLCNSCRMSDLTQSLNREGTDGQADVVFCKCSSQRSKTGMRLSESQLKKLQRC